MQQKKSVKSDHPTAGLNQPFKSVLQDGQNVVLPVVRVNITVYIERNI